MYNFEFKGLFFCLYDDETQKKREIKKTAMRYFCSLLLIDIKSTIEK